VRVVKLGGSLTDWNGLADCLSVLAERPCVIVPGGGPFAEQVRAAQERWRFDDGTAHAMALLGMNQFGRLLAGLEARLHTADRIPSLHARAMRGHTAVWLPDPDDGELTAIPASWDVTSDSLAVWLARRLDASELVLVKSSSSLPADCTSERLTECGMVDRAFLAFHREAAHAVWICFREQYRRLAGPLIEAPGFLRVRPTHPD
jgi:aspartokinase-like uncharacterized kinase